MNKAQILRVVQLLRQAADLLSEVAAESSDDEKKSSLSAREQAEQAIVSALSAAPAALSSKELLQAVRLRGCKDTTYRVVLKTLIEQGRVEQHQELDLPLVYSLVEDGTEEVRPSPEPANLTPREEHLVDAAMSTIDVN